jgi:hypothetical protein
MRSLSSCIVVSLIALALAMPARSEQSHPIDGTWRGVLAGQLHLVATIKGSAGTLESVDQGATLQIDSVSVVGDKVRFTVGRVGGVWEGTRKGETLDGTWTQTGVAPQPLSFNRGEASGPPPKPTPPPKPLDAPISLAVAMAPLPFVGGDGKSHLVYETLITNFASRDIVLRRFEALAPDGKSLLDLDTGKLPAVLERPGLPAPPADATRIGPGLSAIVLVWITLPDGATRPSALDDKITVRVGDDAQDWIITDPVTVRTEPLPLLGPPLEGAGWLAANGPSSTSNPSPRAHPHRRASPHRAALRHRLGAAQRRPRRHA